MIAVLRHVRLIATVAFDAANVFSLDTPCTASPLVLGLAYASEVRQRMDESIQTQSRGVRCPWRNTSLSMLP